MTFLTLKKVKINHKRTKNKNLVSLRNFFRLQHEIAVNMQIKQCWIIKNVFLLLFYCIYDDRMPLNHKEFLDSVTQWFVNNKNVLKVGFFICVYMCVCTKNICPMYNLDNNSQLDLIFIYWSTAYTPHGDFKRQASKYKKIFVIFACLINRERLFSYMPMHKLTCFLLSFIHKTSFTHSTSYDNFFTLSLTIMREENFNIFSCVTHFTA